MSNLNIIRSYTEGNILTEADLDTVKQSVEDFVNVDNITGDVIANGGITASTKLVDESVDSTVVAANILTNTELADNAITTDKFTDNHIEGVKFSALEMASINNAAITNAKFASKTIATAKINNGAVTRAKLQSQVVGTFLSPTSASIDGGDQLIATGNIQVTLSGRKVRLNLVDYSSDSSNPSNAYVINAVDDPGIYVTIQASANNISFTTIYTARYDYKPNDVNIQAYPLRIGLGGLWAIHAPSSTGTWYYRVLMSSRRSQGVVATAGAISRFGLYITELI